MVDTAKVKVVLEWNSPKNIFEVHNILGLVGYYKRFVKGFSMIVTPFTKLLKKKENFVWRDESQQSFEKMKAIMIKALVLSQSEPGVEYTIYTNESLNGLGCVLMQRGKVISYTSRKLKPHELQIVPSYQTPPILSDVYLWDFAM